jgi:hypothetical protein
MPQAVQLDLVRNVVTMLKTLLRKISAGSKPSNIELTPMPKPTGNARRADSSDSAVPSCLPYTIVQGKEVFEFHMTDPRPGLWTMDQKCSWKGEMTKADMTCSMSAGGEIAKSLHGDLVQSSVPLAQKDISLDNPTPYVTAVIVTATGGASGSASPTPSGGASGSGSAKGSASGSGSGSGASSVTGSAKPTASAPAASGAPAQGSGAFAVVGPMAFVAGAAGILAAALVL